MCDPFNIGTRLTSHFRGTRAVGIEYMDDVVGRPGSAPEIKSVWASRLVVVSAGAFGSPSILERSGIGAESILKEHNVMQLVDLPGVGEHYMGKIIKYYVNFS